MPHDAIRPIRCSPSMHRSLTNSATRGVRSASLRSARVAAPNRARAVIGAKFGGWGISRESAGKSTAATITDERGDRNREGAIEVVLSAGPGKKFYFDTQAATPARTDGPTELCRMLEAEASKQLLGGSVFWLT